MEMKNEDLGKRAAAGGDTFNYIQMTIACSSKKWRSSLIVDGTFLLNILRDVLEYIQISARSSMMYWQSSHIVFKTFVLNILHKV